MEWTENKTKLLIEEVEKHPFLYNCKLDEYHNRDLRTVSWQRVAEACGSTGMIPASKSPYFVVFVLAIYCLRNSAVAEAILLRKKVVP